MSQPFPSVTSWGAKSPGILNSTPQQTVVHHNIEESKQRFPHINFELKADEIRKNIGELRVMEIYDKLPFIHTIGLRKVDDSDKFIKSNYFKNHSIDDIRFSDYMIFSRKYQRYRDFMFFRDNTKAADQQQQGTSDRGANQPRTSTVHPLFYDPEFLFKLPSSATASQTQSSVKPDAISLNTSQESKAEPVNIKKVEQKIIFQPDISSTTINATVTESAHKIRFECLQKFKQNYKDGKYELIFTGKRKCNVIVIRDSTFTKLPPTQSDPDVKEEVCFIPNKRIFKIANTISISLIENQ